MVIVVALLAAGSRIVAQPSVPGRPLTLVKAVDTAAAQNPGLEAARLRARQVEAMLAESRAAFLPWIGASYGGIRGDWPHVVIGALVDARAFPDNTYLNTPGTYFVSSATAEARLSIWAGGRDRARAGMAAASVTIAGQETDAVRNVLTAQVVEAFYDVLAAGERVGHATAFVETTRGRRDEERRRFEEGAVLKAELADVEARVAEAESVLVHATTARSRALAALAVALGLPPASELSPEDGEDAFRAAPDERDAGLALALANRPELERARLMTRRRELGVRAAKADFLPRLDVNLSVGSFREGDLFPSFGRDQKVWYGGFTLSLDVFDGGARVARLRKARAELDEMRENDRATTLAIELDVENAYLRLREARAGLDAAERRLEAAREMRELRKVKFEEGAATLAASLEGEQMLTEALMGRTSASFELRKARADAARALGLFAGRP